jgi:Tfp pilus assembly protein PilO
MNRKPALISAAVGVGVILIMLVGLISPKASQVRNKQKEIQGATQEQTTLQTQLEQLQAAQKDAPKDRKRLAALATQIPPSADLPGLIRLLDGTADKAGVDFASIAPGQPTPEGDITTIPVQITVKGTFFAVDQYLYLLEKLPRVSKVTTLTVTPIDQTINPPQLQVALSANFYTTDTSAGPGSIPGGAQEQPPAVEPTPVPSPTGA